MKKTIMLVSLLSLVVLTVAAQTSPKVYPLRWVRVGSGLRSDADVEKIRKIAEVAARHGLTGIVLSAGLDSMDLRSEDYHQRLKKVRELCESMKLDIIPSFLSAGYGGAVLAHDKNLAAGLPVKEALFAVRGGTARLVPDPAVELVNGNFETTASDSIPGFEVTGKPGEFVVADEAVFQSGKKALRFQNFKQAAARTVSIRQQVAVRPYRCYRIRCFIKSENLRPSDPFGSGNFQLRVLGGEEKRPLQFENPRLSANDDWHQVSVSFNSWGYRTVEIVPSLSGGGEGKFWIDDLRVEEIGLVNLLRRPGTPLVVKSETTGLVYEEGRDFQPVADEQMNFRWDREGPPIVLLPDTRIREGERLRVDFYHGTRIYNDQTPVCMSEPKVYEIWEKGVRMTHEALAPRYYLLNMDELRTGGSCEACRKRNITMGQILGDALTRQQRIIRTVNPQAEVFVWSDMLDPNHNARPDRKWYYLAEGTYTDSWKYIPKDLGIVCWYYEVREASLKHFSRLGFRTIAGSYYDADTLENPKGWLRSLDQTTGARGILYTTWLDKYDLLGPFGDLVSKRPEE